jgi:hypothetical protein
MLDNILFPMMLALFRLSFRFFSPRLVSGRVERKEKCPDAAMPHFEISRA